MSDESKAFAAVQEASHRLHVAQMRIADTVSIHEHDLKWLLEDLYHQQNDGDTDFDFSSGIEMLKDLLKSLSDARAARNDYLDASRAYHRV